MASTQQKSLINTAACLIIGDEVLGGKVCRSWTIGVDWQLLTADVKLRQSIRTRYTTQTIANGSSANVSQAYFAKFCFSLGINLRRIEVIADDEGEIVEAVQRMSRNYDMVVTSGGIGPT